MNRVLKTTAVLLMAATLAFAQDTAPPTYTPAQLDSLVSRIALYPDPLLVQVLAASTFSDQIADAANWADAHRNLAGSDLANAMTDASLPFDPSVQALIPFPTVIDMMASDPQWTYSLGSAVLAQRPDVMDAVQRMRQAAENYGYLANSGQLQVVADGGAIEILPVNPAVIYVPVYDPLVVFGPPAPGFYVAGAIRFPFCFTIGAAFNSWGWGGSFYWPSHTLVVHNVIWGRTWSNRYTYVHNYGNWENGHWRSDVINRPATARAPMPPRNRPEGNLPAMNQQQSFRRPAPEFAPRPNYTPAAPRQTIARAQVQRPAPQTFTPAPRNSGEPRNERSRR